MDVGDLDPKMVAETHQAAGGDSKTGGAYVSALPDRSAVFIQGTEEQITEAKEALEAMKGEPAPGIGKSARFRTVTLESGNAVLLAEELARVLGQWRKNPVEVVAPEKFKSPKKKPESEKLKKPPKSETETRLRKLPGKPGDLKAVSYQDSGLVDPREKKDAKGAKDTRPGTKEKPIRIFASGNRLLIASDDAEALALVQQLIRLYTTQPGKGAFQVLKLNHGDATEAAKALDEAFNGSKQQNNQPQQPFNPWASYFARFGRQGAQPPANPEENKIRVVAYPATNSLLVRATALDMLAIKDLLAKALDN
jgi:hypothetical protein